MSFLRKTGATLGITYILFLFLMLWGWVGHLIWAFQQTEPAQMMIGIIGGFLPFAGALHYFIFLF